jgi:hypothetical protein
MTDGGDALQLENNLQALGHGAGLTVHQHVSSSTCWAVRRRRKDPVVVHLPDGITKTGAVTTVGATATRSGSTAETAAGKGFRATDTVVVTMTGEGGSMRHVPVDTGLFNEFNSLAEVSGAGGAAGQRLLVAGGGS